MQTRFPRVEGPGLWGLQLHFIRVEPGAKSPSLPASPSRPRIKGTRGLLGPGEGSRSHLQPPGRPWELKGAEPPSSIMGSAHRRPVLPPRSQSCGAYEQRQPPRQGLPGPGCLLRACHGEKLLTPLGKLHACAHSLDKRVLSACEWRTWMDWQSVVSDRQLRAHGFPASSRPASRPLQALPGSAAPVEAPTPAGPGRCGLRQVAEVPCVPSPSRWCQVHTGHV